MVHLRWVITALVGFLIVLAGVFVAAPGVMKPVSPLLERNLEAVLVNSAAALVVLGLASGLVGVLIANRAGSLAPEKPDLAAIRGGVNSTATGAEFDERLEELSVVDEVKDRADLVTDLREDLRGTAVTVLTRRGGLSADEVETQLDNGGWTDDPQAAAFFARLGPSWDVRLQEWLSPRSAVELRVDRVLAELEAHLDLPSAGPDSQAFVGTKTDRRAGGQLENAAAHRVGDEEAELDHRSVETERHPGADDETGGGTPQVVGTRRFGLTVGLLSAAIGLVTHTTGPFMLGFLAVGYSLTKYLTSAPEPHIEVTRLLASDSPVPGDLVEVELRVTNTGKRPLTDLRVVDGLPSALRIVEGSPAMATSLQPDATASLQYAFRAKRGTYTFDDTKLIARDLGNVWERALGLRLRTRLTVATQLDELALEEQTSQRIGTVKTDRGGSGVEFYSTREYRTGDPLSRVNWNQLAKSGELATIEFREQRSPTVAIVLDQREEARVAPTEAALDGVDLSVYAAEQAFLKLLDGGTEVGLITYGERLTDIEPANDAAQRALVQSRLRVATERYAAALGEAAVETAGAVYQRLSPEPQALEHHVPRNAQVLALSPAIDGFAVETTERLMALGHQVTLLTPSVSGAGTPGSRRARLDRACRLEAIRDEGTRVIDWQPDEPLQIAVARAIEVT